MAFQLSLALGAPFGRAAMGGNHEGQLPSELRVVSVLAAPIWAFAAVVVLRRAGLRATPRASPLLRRGAWIVVGVLAFGALLNFASPSPWERFMWGPFSLILAGLCALVAPRRLGDLVNIGWWCSCSLSVPLSYSDNRDQVADRDLF